MLKCTRASKLCISDATISLQIADTDRMIEVEMSNKAQIGRPVGMGMFGSFHEIKLEQASPSFIKPRHKLWAQALLFASSEPALLVATCSASNHCKSYYLLASWNSLSFLDLSIGYQFIASF